MSLLRQAGVEQTRVLAEPEPSVLIKSLGDNGIELELTTWIRDAEEGQASLRSAILLNVLCAFRKEGIDIPYPQREIRLSAAHPTDALLNGSSDTTDRKINNI